MLKFLNTSEEDWSKRRFHDDHHAAVRAKRWTRRGSTAGVSKRVAQARLTCSAKMRFVMWIESAYPLLLTVLRSGTHGAEVPRMPGSFWYSRSVSVAICRASAIYLKTVYFETY